MKQRLCAAGQILNCAAFILLFVMESAERPFPLSLRFAAIICFLAGLAANLTLLRESIKNARQNKGGKPQ